MFLQGARVRFFSLFLAAPLTGAGFPASGRRSCRGTVTPPGPAEIHLAAQKRGIDSQVLLFSLTVPGKTCSRSRGPVVNHHTANPRTLIGSSGGRQKAL